MSELACNLRDRAIRLVVLVVAAAGLVAVAPSPSAGARDDAPRRWSGYKIPANGNADGGWIGGYRVDGTRLFLTTPRKRPNRAGYASELEIGDLPGRKTSQSETARAAWILSKYGAYKDATQAAAVDATVYHLLVGGKWEINRPRGKRRIRQSGNRAAVARFARIMLRQSKKSAGSYSASLTSSGTDVGGTVAVTLSVTDGHGRPAAGLPVTLTMSGAAPVTAVTGDDGRAVARFAAQARGWQDVSATVTQVPEHRLRAWSAEKNGQASAAEGGVRRTLVVSDRVAVRGPQTLALGAVDDDITAGSPAGVTATVSGDGVPRTATASLHGPFPTAAATTCQHVEVGRVSSIVGADGTYQLPTVTPSASGYYAWGVSLAGTDTSHAVSACGATTTVKAVAAISVAAQELALAVGNVAHVRVGLSGLPRSPALTVTATLWGPFVSESVLRNAACSGTLKLQDEKRMNGDGSEVLDVYVDEVGWYAWQAEVPPDELRQGSRSQCLAAGTLLEVR